MRQDERVSSNPASTAVAGDQTAGVQATGSGSEPDESSQVPVVESDAEVGPEADSEGAVTPATERVVVLLDGVARGLARAAAVAEAGTADHVGDFMVALAEDDIAVTAIFAARQAGYRGWHWSVTLAVLQQTHPTVSEVVLLPGDGALLAPAWIPWDERIRPGDLGVGDLLPPAADDPRVVPAYLLSDDPAIEAVARELGIGRVRVLSREGRFDFAERLHDGSFGPTDEMALAAPAHCVSCAFYLPLAGSLGQLLGACGNEFAPADGRVVDAGYGCGAHSETVIQMPARSAATDVVIDELSLDVHRRPIARPVEPDAAEVPMQEVGIHDEVLPVDVIEPMVPDIPDADEVLLDEWTDPYTVGRELAEVELAEAALLDAGLFDAGTAPDAPDEQG
jgi:hypothetical protein